MSIETDVDIDAVFSDGLRQKRLLLQIDTTTHRAQFFPRPLSLHSEGGMRWIEASGCGKIVALTVNRFSESGAPSLLAWIRLEEGVRILARVEGEPEGLSPGQMVALSWQPVGDERAPVFRAIKVNGDSQ
jgi:uncharacterized OB-fold protein